MKAPALALALLLAALPAAAGPGASVVSVEGSRFLKDGEPWVAEGVTLVGFVQPEARLPPAYARARAKYGPDLLADVRAFGADLVRLQVSQEALDPRSPHHDPGYRAAALGAVALARAEGFVVIASMQWWPPPGVERRPTEGTRRAWEEIVGALGQDRGILLELLNEPGPRRRTAENWAIWQEGMQSLIDAVREAGAENVLLIDGMRAAHFLGGAPPLDDPSGQLGYAVHPYLTAINRTRRQWDENFGDFAKDHPVMATEFNARSGNGYCRESFPREVARLIAYLERRSIGLVVWAFDLPGVVRRGAYTDYEDFACGPGNFGGAGQAVHELFVAD